MITLITRHVLVVSNKSVILRDMDTKVHDVGGESLGNPNPFGRMDRLQMHHNVTVHGLQMNMR